MDDLKSPGVVVEDRVTEAAWRARIAEIVALLNTPIGEPTAQDWLEYSLSLLWSAMEARPQAVRQAYLRLQETRIAEIAEPRAKALGLVAHSAWAPDLASELPALVLAVAAEIRALDQALDQVRDHGGRAVDPNTAFAAWGGEPVFILPRPEGVRARPRRDQDFDRRGLIYNRILPQFASGVPVRLYEPRVQGPGAKGEAADAISAVFSALELRDVRDADNTEFWIDGIVNQQAVQLDLQAQLDELGTGGPAMTVVWPELCMPPGLLSALKAGLERHAWSETPPELGFVVAGSWHEDRKGGRINVAQVLDRLGEPLLEVTKREAFSIEPGVLEAITPGAEISVLIYGQVLVAFGICKDFCEKRWTTAYRLLDVDFVIAPSLGTEGTMKEHEKAAGDLAAGYGTRGFVVQQMAKGEWGMALWPGRSPRSASKVEAQNKLLARSTVSCTMS